MQPARLYAGRTPAQQEVPSESTSKLDSAGRPSRRRRRLFAVAATVLGLGFSVALLETGLRLAPPAWLEQRMRELNAGEPFETGSDQDWPVVLEGRAFRQFVPHSRFVVRHYEYRHDATIDELGGRTTPFPPDYRGVVPFIGDSFTFGVGVEDDECFVSRIAAATLRSQSRYRLLNLGVTGTALHNQLDTLELRHEELGSPELYVFSMFLGNDLTNVRRKYQRAALDGSARQGTRRLRWLWQANVYVYHHPLLKKLYAVQFLRQAALAVIQRGSADLMDPVFLAMRRDRTYLADSLVFWRRELARLERLAERLGFDVVFLLIPDVHQLDDARRAGKAKSIGLDPDQLDPGQVTAAVSQVLRDSGIRYLDLSPCLARAPVGKLYYTQDTHFTAAGHAEAARCLLDGGLLQSQAALSATDRSVGPSADNAP